MAYTLPRVQIAQEFNQVAAFTEKPLAALVIGPHYKLARYSESSEKASTVAVHPTTPDKGSLYQNANLAASDADYASNYSASDVVYSYPNKPATADVDTNYVKVNFENVEATYFPVADITGTIAVRVATTGNIANLAAHGTIDGETLSNGHIVLVKNQNTASENGIYTSDGTGLTRHTSFNETGEINFGKTIIVELGTANAGKKFALYGDKIPVLGTDNIVYKEVTNVTPVDAVNKPTRIKVAGSLKTSGSIARNEIFSNRDVQVGDIIEIFYDGAVDVTVKSKIRSISNSNVPAYVSEITADETGNIDVGELSVEPSSLTDFTGTSDITYTLTVTRAGGYFTGSNASTCGQLTVTSNGADSGVGTISPAHNTYFNVGTQKIRAKFQGSASDEFNEGDTYTIKIVAAKPGPYNIIEINDIIPYGGSVGSPLAGKIPTDATNVVYKLRLPKATLSVPKFGDAAGADLFWNPSSTGVTIDKDIYTQETTLVATGSSALAKLPVTRANVYISYRALLKDKATSISSIKSASSVESELGVIHPDNPLSNGVYKAVLNSAETTVYYVAVGSDDLTGYNTALGLAKKSNKYYGIVPLSLDSTVHDAVVSHVNGMSTPKEAKWRVAWLCKALAPTSLLYDKKVDNSDWLGTTQDDPNDGVTAYTLVTVLGATFITDGVRVGDSVRTNFRVDGAGTTLYDTYTVTEVRSETQLIIETGTPSAYEVAIKIQVVRNFTKDEQITNLAAAGSGYNNRRVRTVFPETVKSGGVSQSGIFLAAALAGLRSGVAPHQGLTNVEVLGFDDLSQAVTEFSVEQLDTLADAGYWIVTQEAVGATAYTRHQLTTDSSDLNFREDSVVSNVDSISYALQDVLAPYIGVYNINPVNLLIIRSAINGELNFRISGTATATAGNQLLDGSKITRLVQSATFKDRIEADIQLVLPYPNNNTDITLII
jgi:hypothetical protein